MTYPYQSIPAETGRRHSPRSLLAVSGLRAFPALVLLAALACPPAGAQALHAVTVKNLTLAFDPATRVFHLSDAQAGVLLDRIVVSAKAGRRALSSADHKLPAKASADPARGELAVALGPELVVKATLTEDALQIRAEGKLNGPASLHAVSGLGADALPCLLKEEAARDNGVLVTTLGAAEIPTARSLFDARNDLALTAGPPEGARWIRSASPAAGWELRASAPAGRPLLALKLHPHYYRDELGVTYYAPIRKPKRWPTAPVVAMTWYGIEAMKGRPAQTLERLLPQIDWVAHYLKPYAGDNLIFQLDDNYPQNDDAAMRALSDAIRARGLVPGIWFTPFTVAPKAVAQQHPEWFLHERNGKPIPTFGGVNWGGDYTLNVTNPQAVDAWFGMWWHKASETWNFDFFKIDGQPDVVNAYRRAADGLGLAGYRKGLEIGRGIVGDEKFINGCWGVPPEAIGWVNGSRTGPDTGYFPDATGVVIEWNFLNNLAWYSDPDATACLYRSTLERARQNAQSRVLTGQQFLTDDLWTQVSPAIRRVWQCSFPTLDVKPANLYRISQTGRYDLFDLKVAKPWGHWDVAGVFNYEGKRVQKTLDLARLPLDAGEVHVWDYWHGLYLGRCKRDAKIPLVHAPYEGQLFALVPAVDNRPALVSTSRHLSQGALDLEALSWKQERGRWVVRGRSSHLVPGDPYELVFVPGRFQVEAAKSTQGPVTVTRGGGAARVSFVPRRGSGAEWEVVFAPIRDALPEATPASLTLPAGGRAELEIRNLGPKPARLRVTSSDPRLKLSGVPASLGRWPAAVKLVVSADLSGLERGAVLEGKLTVAAEGSRTPPQEIAVRALAPLPENLALKAKAQASSIWDGGYTAPLANDGNPETRWNPRKGDENGCWLELAWEAPTRFDRVVIDECLDFGERTQAWKLLAGDGELREIAGGTTLGRRHEIRLKQPLEAKRLRLLIEKATETPTIWEMEVYAPGK